MIESIVTYMGTWPQWLQIIIILGIFLIFVGIMGVIIYKIFKSKELRAGSIVIDMESDTNVNIDVTKNE